MKKTNIKSQTQKYKINLKDKQKDKYERLMKINKKDEQKINKKKQKIFKKERFKQQIKDK